MNNILAPLLESTTMQEYLVVLRDYIKEEQQLHNITEYWIIDPHQKTIEKYLLKNKVYELDVKVHNGNIISSAVIKRGFLFLPKHCSIKNFFRTTQ